MWARAVLMRACCSAVITVGGASLPGWACFLSGPAAANLVIVGLLRRVGLVGRCSRASRWARNAAGLSM